MQPREEATFEKPNFYLCVQLPQKIERVVLTDKLIVCSQSENRSKNSNNSTNKLSGWPAFFGMFIFPNILGTPKEYKSWIPNYMMITSKSFFSLFLHLSSTCVVCRLWNNIFFLFCSSSFCIILGQKQVKHTCSLIPDTSLSPGANEQFFLCLRRPLSLSAVVSAC